MQDFKKLLAWRKAHTLFLAVSDSVTPQNTRSVPWLRSQVFRSRGFPRDTTGYTIIELILVVIIAGIVMAIAIPRGVSMLDRVAVQSAASDVHATLSLARSLALSGNAAVAVDIDSINGVLQVRRGVEILLSRNIALAHGVRLDPTRDSLTYDPRGLGRGAANLSVVIRRRSAAETVFVSRLGRVR